MFLSIIVPAYNVEAYIATCLDSCLCQDIERSDYEIIVINDGSTDNTLGEIESFKQTHQPTNIKVYSQENRGLSRTRNRGVDLSSADYVWFVDSDDYIEKNCLNHLRSSLKEKPDMAVISTVLRKESATQTIGRALGEGRLTGKEVYDNSFVFPFSGAPFYLFKRSFLNDNGLRFKENIYFEDMLFTPVALSLTDDCRYVRGDLYYYCVRENSITTTRITEKKLQDLMTVSEELHQTLQGKQVRYASVLSESVCRTNECLLRYYLLKAERSLRRKYLAKMSDAKCWRQNVASQRLKHKVYYMLFLLVKLFGV